MKTFFKNELTRLFLFVTLCLIIAAIVSPYLYSWGKNFAAENAGGQLSGWTESLRRSMGRADFDRYFNRAMLVTAILLLYPFIRSLKDHTKTVIKPPLTTRLNPGKQGWKDLFIGFIYALGYMCIMFMLLYQLGWLTLKLDPKSLSSALTSALSTAFIVSIIEEWLFRGVLFALLLRSLRPKTAIIGLSVFFAAVHFLKPLNEIADPTSALAGFELLGQIGLTFLNPEFIIGVFLTLFLVGVILGYARHTTGYIWLSIGLHAGWVFSMKMFHSYTLRNPQVKELFYGADIRQGLIPLVFVALTGVAIYFYLRPKSPIYKISPAPHTDQ